MEDRNCDPNQQVFDQTTFADTVGINGYFHLKPSSNKAKLFTLAHVICIIYGLYSTYNRDVHPFLIGLQKLFTYYLLGSYRHVLL